MLPNDVAAVTKIVETLTARLGALSVIVVKAGLCSDAELLALDDTVRGALKETQEATNGR